MRPTAYVTQDNLHATYDDSKRRFYLSRFQLHCEMLEQKPQTIVKLWTTSQKTRNDFLQMTLVKTVQNFCKRQHKCMDKNGGHFQRLIIKWHIQYRFSDRNSAYELNSRFLYVRFSTSL